MDPPRTPSADDKKTSSPADTSDDYLDGWPLYSAAISLNISNGVAFVDQVGLSTTLSAVSNHFHGNTAIEFATTAQLIGATAGQCILGYLSDIWSRRTMLLIALAIQATCSILIAITAHTQAAPLFTILRIFSGVALGSISNLVNVSQNDILSAERRPKYQGIQGLSIAGGSTLGIMVGAVLSQSDGGWEYFYYMTAGLAVCAWVGVWWCVPQQTATSKGENLREALAGIDKIGIISGTAGLGCGLLLLCQYSNLSTVKIIGLGVGTAVALGIYFFFGFTGWYTSRPIIPFKLFRNRTLAAIYVQNILFGAAYYTFIYFVPVTLEVVRRINPVKAAAMMIPYFVTHGLWSTASVPLVKWLKNRGYLSYTVVFAFGFSCWTLASGLLAWDSLAQRAGVVAALGAMVGLGTGSVFQNSVQAIRAQVTREDNAVATGTRNVLRYLGGAIGTALSSVIIQTSLATDKQIPDSLRELTKKSVFDIPLSTLNPQDQASLRMGFAIGISNVFFTSMAMVAACLLLTTLIQDNRNQAKKVGDVEKGELTPNESATSSNEHLPIKESDESTFKYSVSERNVSVGASSQEDATPQHSTVLFPGSKE